MNPLKMSSDTADDSKVVVLDCKTGYLDIKVPATARSRRVLKAWRKRWIDIRKISSEKIIIRVYISEMASTVEPALYRRELTSKQVTVFRSQSKTHPYAFSVAEDKETVLHFSGDSETETQKWMRTFRNLIFPLNDVLQLESILAGVHEVSVIDNEFSQRAGLLGSYGYLRISNKKIILIHPHTGHVIQEWYLNTLYRFQLLPYYHKEDKEKLFSIEAGKDSSTGSGVVYFYSANAMAILQQIGSAIQHILEQRKKLCKTSFEKEQFLKDLQELQGCLQIPEVRQRKEEEESHYQVPRREVRSLLDIPNFTFGKPLAECLPESKKDYAETNQRHSCPEMEEVKIIAQQRAAEISLKISDDVMTNQEESLQTENNKSSALETPESDAVINEVKVDAPVPNVVINEDVENNSSQSNEEVVKCDPPEPNVVTDTTIIEDVKSDSPASDTIMNEGDKIDPSESKTIIDEDVKSNSPPASNTIINEGDKNDPSEPKTIIDEDVKSNSPPASNTIINEGDKNDPSEPKTIIDEDVKSNSPPASNTIINEGDKNDPSEPKTIIDEDVKSNSPPASNTIINEGDKNDPSESKTIIADVKSDDDNSKINKDKSE